MSGRPGTDRRGASGPISILNHVLGPVMRGPSSSHTAGAHRIATMARSLLGRPPSRVVIALDAQGSYARTFREQGADLAFASGLLGWSLADERFFSAAEATRQAGMRIDLRIGELEGPDHPNCMDLALHPGEGAALELRAHSIGGGAVEITRVGSWPVRLTGEGHEVLMELEDGVQGEALALAGGDGELMGDARRESMGRIALLHVRRRTALSEEVRAAIEALPKLRSLRECEPVLLVRGGEAMASCAAELVGLARRQGGALGEAALEYESALLGISEREVRAEVLRRWEVMREAVRQGLEGPSRPMQLLDPSAGRVLRAEAEGRLALGGIHTRAAARALAVMHVNASMGVVCAAPTGGSAGVLPGTLGVLEEERGLDREGVALALLAAGAIGMAVAARATFAAEVAGCQVEIGAAGAMAAAAVVQAAGGSAEQATDAAAISLQNTMGSVCDLVGGMVEIPCHTRNAVAASSAFVCADLILGGYRNPIPLDETIDASFAVGRMLPGELRCTARGGLAVTPTAMAMRRP